MKPRTEQFALYWDEPPKAKQWYKKGKFKTYYRKKWFKNVYKIWNLEEI